MVGETSGNPSYRYRQHHRGINPSDPKLTRFTFGGMLLPDGALAQFWSRHILTFAGMELLSLFFGQHLFYPLADHMEFVFSLCPKQGVRTFKEVGTSDCHFPIVICLRTHD